MNNLKSLVIGEFQRLTKYNLLKVNLVILIFYLAIAYFVEGEAIKTFMPFIIMIDATLMTALMTAATLFYEKKEHTMNTLIVTSATTDEIIISKIISNIINSSFSVIILGIGIFFLKGVIIDILPLIGASILACSFHTLIGLFISYKSKNFTGTLVGYMAYTIVFAFPSFLLMGGIIPVSASDYFIILPPEASNVLFQNIVTSIDTWKIVFSTIYLLALTIFMYIYIIKPKFHEYAIKEVGV